MGAMTQDELEVLLAEIAEGRTEDTRLEWKSRWWNFGVEESWNKFSRNARTPAIP